MRSRWAWWAASAVMVAGALRLRRRAGALRTAAAPAPPEDHAGGFAWLTAEGVEVGEGARREVEGFAAAEGLEAVDVVPRDLPPERAIALLRSADPARFRGDRLATGATALQAIVATRALLERAGLSPGEGLDPVSLDAAARSLKLYAPVSVDFFVCDAVRAAPEDLAKRKALWRERLGPAWGAALARPVLTWGFLATGLALSPAAGTAAVAAWSLQPFLALAATPLAPQRDGRRAGLARACLLRWPRAVAELARTTAGTWRPPPGIGGRVDPESLRPAYEKLLEDGAARFFENRRPDCPWCGSEDLSVAVETPDLLQGKPGRFVLERCRACGHVFQNPRLSLEGLDFYYRDFYDGIGAEQMGFVFGAGDRSYRARARMLERRLRGGRAPRRWLDVGTGHGHFCLVAAGLLPSTRFDGLDMSASIEEAERRSWVAKGWRGLFPDLAPALAGEDYDVVSMHHYLEHTREPLEELDAAARVLRPGAMLLVEIPDPECVYAGLLGRYWIPWLQPQHQHLPPAQNLCTALEARGFEVVEVHRAEAGQPIDLAGAVWLLLAHLAPQTGVPWRERSRAASLWRWTAAAAAVPFGAVAFAADRAALLVPASRRSNTYRVLARRSVGDVLRAQPV